MRHGQPERLLGQNGLGFDVQTGEGEGQIGTVATHGVHGDLQGGWRWFSLNVVDSHPVRSHLVEFDGVEAGRHVGPEVGR